jgi:type II secretory ATPase GspE/PulE/Tfp pilus assembly ATPase PilB-like protein
VEPFLLVSTLRIIVGQRLVRRLTDGKEQYALDKVERTKVATEDHFDAVLKDLMDEKLVKEGTKLDALPFYHPKASGASEDGYHSRIGIHEILSVSPATKELIMHGGITDAIEAQARKEGMLTMLEDGIYKATRGITSLEEVLRAVAE